MIKLNHYLGIIDKGTSFWESFHQAAPSHCLKWDGSSSLPNAWDATIEECSATFDTAWSYERVSPILKKELVCSHCKYHLLTQLKSVKMVSSPGLLVNRKLTWRFLQKFNPVMGKLASSDFYMVHRRLLLKFCCILYLNLIVINTCWIMYWGEYNLSMRKGRLYVHQGISQCTGGRDHSLGSDLLPAQKWLC